jgi:hypothetical protein
MKRIVTHMLVAVGLAAGACGAAEAHTNLSVGLSLGSPAPAYVTAAPQPVYYRNRYDDRRDYGYRHDRGWERGRWEHGNHAYYNNGYRSNENRRGWGYRD